jgi:hypothetical protein
MRRTHQETPLVQDPSSRWILIHLLTDIRIESINEDITKLVSADDSLVVDIGYTGEETGLRVVCENEELTGWYRSIDAVEC